MRQQFLKKPQSKSRLRRGDTLIEVIISFAILAGVITIATAGALNAWRAQRMAAERTQATGLAQRQADALKAYRKSLGWDNFMNGMSSPSHMDIDSSAATPKWKVTSGDSLGPTPLDQFTQSITNSCASTATTCQFTVTVTWQSAVRPVGSNDEVKLLVTLSDNN